MDSNVYSQWNSNMHHLANTQSYEVHIYAMEYQQLVGICLYSNLSWINTQHKILVLISLWQHEILYFCYSDPASSILPKQNQSRYYFFNFISITKLISFKTQSWRRRCGRFRCSCSCWDLLQLFVSLNNLLPTLALHVLVPDLVSNLARQAISVPVFGRNWIDVKTCKKKGELNNGHVQFSGHRPTHKCLFLS